MPVITCIEDLRQLAEKRVPRMFYDYADSGSWTEGTYRANESDFQAIKLRPDPSLEVPLRRWSSLQNTEDARDIVARALHACRRARPWAS